MEQSILKSTKKILGIGPDDTSFDLDIITHINSAFSILTDIGVGPATGFVIEDDSVEWASYIEDVIQLSKVKAAIFLRVRLIFDPPTSGFLLDATQKQLQEAEWRLNVNREGTEWTDPSPPPPTAAEEDVFGDHDNVTVVEGGDAG